MKCGAETDFNQYFCRELILITFLRKEPAHGRRQFFAAFRKGNQALIHRIGNAQELRSAVRTKYHRVSID